MSVNFNINNRETHYKLFFGEDLGLTDAFNITYPEILELDKKQRSLFWAADEIEFSQDFVDFLEGDPVHSELMIRALSMQLAGDSFANGTIAQLFLPIISNPQAKGLVSYWNDTESVHDRAYSLVVAQCFKDPNALLERVRNDEKLLARLLPLINNANEHLAMVADWSMYRDSPESKYTHEERVRIAIRGVATLLALEGIMFLTSFATTFAICEASQRYGGIAKAVGLIHDDEGGSHVANNLCFLNILQQEEPEIFEKVKPEIKEILDLCVEFEHKWAHDLFDGIGDIVGFNTDLLKQYNCYVTMPLYTKLGIEWDYQVVTENPLPWIEPYIKPDLLQVAAQETQVTNYKVNASVDDSDSEDFEF